MIANRIFHKTSINLYNSNCKSLGLEKRIHHLINLQFKQRYSRLNIRIKQKCRLYNTFNCRLNDQGNLNSKVHSANDYFELFSLPQSYDIDKNKLHYHYIELQKKLHPDSHSNLSEQEKKFYQNETSSIINAYKTLKDDYLRAVYLLEKHGIVFSEESQIGGVNENQIEDNMFLMEMFEIREQIDMVDDKEAMEALVNENKEKIKKCVEELSVAFRENDIEKAKKKTVLLKFLSKIVEEAENKLFDLSKD